ncbi:peptidase domain-containing ABC transporter [Chlorobium phaeobacteroides]|uniref:Cyclic nucleotide-regulated ABC bacteriocin/lantibiotic exporters n=1 Tax=Chlorobium phaeobacteroides (strain DSM 266 / SMG 266 / 2430) TaxID=290317 RepID=A1BHI2_CHLPD|nr:peptidase domain-containing ABC transporter [Chlorobium phaeobacteroides]ABL65859.1 cyclic nucleotide-regulated ABC bacteriocin/lantibiotic exporters [Chlorobium phaeobacteroides DSM 266]
MTTLDNTTPDIRKLLAAIPLFTDLTEEKMSMLLNVCSVAFYSIGKPVISKGALPDALYIVSSGRVRSLFQSGTGGVQTLRLLGAGDMFGWVSLVRNEPTEIVTASEETVCIRIPVSSVTMVVNALPHLYDRLSVTTDPAEIGLLLEHIYSKDPKKESLLQGSGFSCIKDLALHLYQSAVVVDSGFSRTVPQKQLRWFVSRSGDSAYSPGSEYHPPVNGIPASLSLRLVGLDLSCIQESLAAEIPAMPFSLPEADSPDLTDEASAGDDQLSSKRDRFSFHKGEAERKGGLKGLPFFKGRGVVEETFACFQMLGKQLNVPIKKDLIQSIIGNQYARNGQLSLQDCGGVGVVLGLKAQVVSFQQDALPRLKVPALVRWEKSFAVLYKASASEVVLAIPASSGIKVLAAREFWESWEHKGEALVLDARADTPEQKFGFDWFAPSLKKYRNVLGEVMIASFFTQIMTLVNPLLFMIIIDQVIVRNSYATLHVLGMFMLIIALLQAVLNSLRTYLFVDTTNRIDVALGAEVIDHLLRLPLRFFEKRPVGELSSRIGELERIRQFLTGTALGVVLDAVFSVVYVIVLFAFSWKLALMALSVVPLIGLVTFLLSPVIRKQLREKAIKHGQTNAYLIEVLSGIQTVKSQNIELRARWNWQEKYAAYVKEGFKPVVTGTLANSANSFLTQASGLIVIWAGAWLVLNQEMTLGQLIAFRIIAGYITSPVMRLAQLWQNFQETGMSLERLADIVDTPQEGGRDQLAQIPLPLIKGEILAENVSFRFRDNTPMVLKNVSTHIPAGTFVGIVGESGSGKSTFAKLVQRLYALEDGRIYIDHYDISKVELNSLRCQIGIVPQDPMLFDVSVKENISLTNPDASDADIIDAAKIAEAHEFIMALPTGYNTPVGEKGSSLSGGQRQRIAIARTILQNPGLIILDEATSALDPDTESRLTTNMIRAFRGKTVLFITHRLNSVKGAAVILCFHDGCIDESGTHEDLMKRKGRYYSLFQKQSFSMPAMEGNQ